MAHNATVLERVSGCCGELVQQRRDGYFEIVANGVFLMDTRGGGSERLHVTAAADRMPPPGRMLIGGLGVGFSLAAALAHCGVSEVHVLEREPAVLRWNRGPLHLLSPGGVLTIWSAAPAPALVARMKEHFTHVEVTEAAVARGEPDVIVLGRTPRHG